MLMPLHNIEDTNTVAGDTGLAAANTRRPGDPVLRGRRHDSSIKPVSDAMVVGTVGITKIVRA
jgi:hypothetical protein